jgi:RNA polymerase sigma factor (sigma-70 family)
MSNENHEISHAFEQLKQESNDQAAEVLWEEFHDPLLRVAKNQLRQDNKRVVDEEDVVQSVMRQFFEGAKEGRFSEHEDRQDLWRLLVSMMRQKVIDKRRHALRSKRGGGAVRGESVFVNQGEEHGGLDEAAKVDLLPDLIAVFREEKERLFERLPDSETRRIAKRRLQGYSNAEIAEQLGISLRTVERRISTIRSLWSSTADEA